MLRSEQIALENEQRRKQEMELQRSKNMEICKPWIKELADLISDKIKKSQLDFDWCINSLAARSSISKSVLMSKLNGEQVLTEAEYKSLKKTIQERGSIRIETPEPQVPEQNDIIGVPATIGPDLVLQPKMLQMFTNTIANVESRGYEHYTQIPLGYGETLLLFRRKAETK